MYLIDGHNLIGSNAIPGIRLDQEDDEARLVDWLRARQPRLGQSVVVVFDSGIPGGISHALSGGGVTAIFAAQQRHRADAVILKRVQGELLRGHVTVVTNDRVLSEAVRGLGARVMRAQEFVRIAEKRRVKGRKRRSASRPKPEPKPSKREIEEWLALFQQGKREPD
ncbi:MAG: hypothetical protein GXP42_18535 [Chloroflexi bacterium]|nr:hypothetical protein [Chloroflexota bacterium]